MTAPITSLEEVRALAQLLRERVRADVIGRDDIIELVLVALFADGHVLLEDYPGSGKTTLAKSLGTSIADDLQHDEIADFRRIQFTPDLLPSDVTGVTIYHQAANRFEFHPGPVFGNIVLADEINRASPRTQSALLEVMEERQVTVDGVSHPVPRPFMVLATQNPIDMDGTYPLPEAQLDRFLARTSMGYPDHAAELDIVLGQGESSPESRIRPVLSLTDAAAVVGAVHRVHASREVCEYLVRIVAATRQLAEVRLPVSPRGSVGLLRAARSRALTTGRPFVTPDDVKALAAPVLAHRLVLTPEAMLSGLTPEAVLERAVGSVPVPHDRARG
jgi:MoxR-like ATPase